MCTGLLVSSETHARKNIHTNPKYIHAIKNGTFSLLFTALNLHLLDNARRYEEDFTLELNIIRNSQASEMDKFCLLILWITYL